MSLQRYGTHNMVLPPEGPKAVPSLLDFSVKNTITVDLSDMVTAEQISCVSGYYIDNRKNANPLEFKVNGIAQTGAFPAGKCGYIPLLIGDTASTEFTTPHADGLFVQVIAVNFPVWPCTF